MDYTMDELHTIMKIHYKNAESYSVAIDKLRGIFSGENVLNPSTVQKLI